MSETKTVEIPAGAPYVNALLLQMMVGIEDVLGKNGLNAVLRDSGLERYIDNPPSNNLEYGIQASEYAHLNEAVEKFTGRAGKGMLQRIGRSAFRWGVNEQSTVMGFANIAIKALPTRLRKRAVLLAIHKGLIDTVEYGLIDVSEQKDGTLIFTDYACVICHTRHNDHSLCHQYVGSLGEALAFATKKDYRDFDVLETHCKAKEDDFCRFEIKDK